MPLPFLGFYGPAGQAAVAASGQTARQLITRSLRELGVLAVGETATGPEAADALFKLNDLLESWSLERLMVYHIKEVTKTLTGGVGSYTIGSGGDINTARPLRIDEAVLRDAQGLDLDMRILTLEEYSHIALKAIESTSSRWLYFDNAYPLASIFLWPVPSTSDTTLHLWFWQPLLAIESLDTVLTLPPGYSRALRTHLAAELATEYGVEPSNTLVASGIASKMAIKSQLSERVTPELRFDERLPGTRGSYWDYRTGERA
jgi:hypothetical protein